MASCVVDMMFDDMIAKPKPRRWQTAVIVGSALAHAAVFAGVAIAAMWKIEKLDVGETVDITFRVPPPQGAAAPPPAAKLAVRQADVTKVVKIKPPVITQPTIVKDPEPVTTAATTATTGTDTGGPGGDGNDPDADPNSTGTCTTPGACLDGHDGDPPVDDKDDEVIIKQPPPIVPPSVAKGLRYAGNDQIHPPEMVRVDMMHQGKERLMTTVQLCVDEGGTVTSLRLLKSSGFKPYDDKIMREMRDWKYKPYLVNKVPSPMCTVTMFDYRMTRR